MPRLPRQLSTGAIYHVYQRGNNREYIFDKDESKGFFIHQVKEYNKKFDFEVFAFVMMDNHYHMIIKLNNDPLDKIMFNINNVFAHYFNKKYKRTGHVFESRYNCKRVESNANLLWLLRYIHRNPVRANMVNRVDDYKWSSHYFYINRIKDFVNTHFILSIISNNRTKSIKKYLQLMSVAGDNCDNKKDYEIIKDTLIQKWDVNEITLTFDKNKSCMERESLNDISNRIFCDKVQKNLILSGSRRRGLTRQKLAFIKEAINNKYTIKEISNYLNNTEPAVSLLLSRNKM
ncbi:hypothetical protein CPJCM30710_08620 [Clostridium polyendosporum]|uniref:Transposase IS200-like domain-containing protein n=1 Tax=Clostridium polyendosporum TaxID=69208 RepID=A0A919RYS0_9CLOT|nr:transposase [Clostridium polyendosporum]GIM28196.1 hypothetical protein CPJCM30710_08620 [Clostridium polyendosporum]